MTTLDAARSCAHHGWYVVPVPCGEKGPQISGWQNLRITEAQLPKHFNSGQNIGILLGAASGGLVDVDMDVPEAITIGEALLPETSMVHGRPGNPYSHRWYLVTPTDISTRQFSAPDGTRIIELRASGSQTICPPSQHPSGERLLWHQNGPPAQVDAEALTRAVREVAAAALLARSWPVEGSRHGTALALSGAFVRAGWDDEKVSRFIRAVADAAGDEEARERARQGVYTRRRIEAGGRATGLPTLKKLLGEDVVGKVAEWLNLGRSIDGHDHAQVTHFTLTDDGNSDRLVARHGQDLKWCPELGWMFYDGRRWTEDKTGEVRRRAVDTVKAVGTEAAAEPDSAKSADLFKHAARSLSDAKIRAMISSAESKLPITLSEFDADPWLLNVANATIDLRAWELREHRREDLLTRLAPAEHDPNAKCLQWEKFLFRIFDNNLSLIDFVQRAVGHSLTGDTREQVLFVLYGRGQNGKSTFLEILSSVLGNYAMHTPSETLMAKRDAIPNDIARLRGTRFVCATETEEGRRMSEVMVKSLTGGDQITARFLHREWFEFRPTFKLWLACNHRPIVRGSDPAIWRRIRLIPFTITIPPEEQDRELPDKLREELPGVLNWALDGCRAWLEDGLGVPEEVKSATEAYRQDMDAIGGFLEECCIQKAEATTLARDLYATYTAWCERNGEHALTQRSHKMPLIATRPKRELCPQGFFRAHVAKVETTIHPEFGERAMFSFDLDDKCREDGSPIRVFRSCSFKLTPKSTLTGVVQDILGRKLTDKEAEGGFDLESLVGSPVQIVVKHEVSKTGNPYAVVDSVVRVEEEPGQQAKKSEDVPF